VGSPLNFAKCPQSDPSITVPTEVRIESRKIDSVIPLLSRGGMVYPHGISAQLKGSRPSIRYTHKFKVFEHHEHHSIRKSQTPHPRRNTIFSSRISTSLSDSANQFGFVWSFERESHIFTPLRSKRPHHPLFESTLSGDGARVGQIPSWGYY